MGRIVVVFLLTCLWRVYLCHDVIIVIAAVSESTAAVTCRVLSVDTIIIIIIIIIIILFAQ